MRGGHIWGPSHRVNEGGRQRTNKSSAVILLLSAAADVLSDIARFCRLRSAAGSRNGFRETGRGGGSSNGDTGLWRLGETARLRNGLFDERLRLNPPDCWSMGAPRQKVSQRIATCSPTAPCMRSDDDDRDMKQQSQQARRQKWIGCQSPDDERREKLGSGGLRLVDWGGVWADNQIVIKHLPICSGWMAAMLGRRNLRKGYASLRVFLFLFLLAACKLGVENEGMSFARARPSATALGCRLNEVDLEHWRTRNSGDRNVLSVCIRRRRRRRPRQKRSVVVALWEDW